MKMGVDFGSTFTTVSTYDEVKQNVESLVLMQGGTTCLPTVVAKNKKKQKYTYGVAAKGKTGNPNETVFKGFKILLPETAPSKIAQRGYTKEDTPERIAAMYLKYVLDLAMSSRKERSIEKLVICVPEIWNDGIGTLDGRRIVRDICMGLELGSGGEKAGIQNVQVVSEPTAASAYFAYNYLKSTGENYDGYVLLIDYGGGTLDITLTNVSVVKRENESWMMEIKTVERTGAGEHKDGEIGQAGIRYMEGVVKEAISRTGVVPVLDEEFYRMVNNLETCLLSQTIEIENLFQDNGLRDLEELLTPDENELMTDIYHGEDITVTYSLLVDVYDQVIRGALDEKLREMIHLMEVQGVDYRDTQQERFKIALVGGFCNFYLVKKQVEDLFGLSAMDRRTENIILHREDREQAVSLGAALLAADIVGICYTAPYSISVNRRVTSGDAIEYAFRYRQDITYNKPYFIRTPGGNKQIFIIPQGKIDNLVYNSGVEDRTAQVLTLKREFANLLSGVAKDMGLAAIGFSLDSSGVLSIHVLDYDEQEERFAGESRQVELGAINRMVDLDNVKWVFKR